MVPVSDSNPSKCPMLGMGQPPADKTGGIYTICPQGKSAIESAHRHHSHNVISLRPRQYCTQQVICGRVTTIEFVGAAISRPPTLQISGQNRFGPIGVPMLPICHVSELYHQISPYNVRYCIVGALRRRCFPYGETTGRMISAPTFGACNVGGRVPPNYRRKYFGAVPIFH